MTHPIAMMKTCTAALLFVAALLLAQVEPASAAPYNGDIGETRFTSDGRTYILKRYAKPSGGSGGGVVLVTPEPEQGTYEIVDPTQEAGRWNRSFDYDPKSGVLTLYDDGGPTERWTFLPWKGWDPGDVKVEHLVPGSSAYDAVYEYQQDRDAYVAYIPGIGERTLPEYIVYTEGSFNIMKENLDQGKECVFDWPTPAGGFHEFVVRKTKKKASAPQASPAVPARYMVVDANDSSEWTAFSYDTATGVFTMYEPDTDNGEKPYAYRRFLSDGRLEDNDLRDGTQGTFVQDGSGKYRAGATSIYRYVTDGMRLFLQKIR